MSLMKRRALGRGLGSLIPGAPPLPPPGLKGGDPPGKPPHAADPAPSPAEKKPAITMSAADMAKPQEYVPIETNNPEAAKADAVRELPLDWITANPEQPRQTIPEEQLEELAASIRTSGILQPILVRPWGEKFQL